MAAQKVWDYMCAAPSQGAFQGERRAVTPPIGLQPYTTMMSAHSHGPGLQSLGQSLVTLQGRVGQSLVTLQGRVRWGGWLFQRRGHTLQYGYWPARARAAASPATASGGRAQDSRALCAFLQNQTSENKTKNTSEHRKPHAHAHMRTCAIAVYDA